MAEWTSRGAGRIAVGETVTNAVLLSVDDGGDRFEVHYLCCGRTGDLARASIEQRIRQGSMHCRWCANRARGRAPTAGRVPRNRRVSTADAIRAWLAWMARGREMAQ